MILSTSRKVKDATKQKVLSFQKVCQKCKMVIKIEFTPHSLCRPQNLSLRVLKMLHYISYVTNHVLYILYVIDHVFE